MRIWLKRIGLVLLLPMALILLVGIWFGVKVLTYDQQDDETHMAAKQEYLKTLTSSAAENSTRPNIIFILYDDLGYGDFGVTGSKAINTPTVDQLAAGGVQLSNFYSPAAVCTPSRVGMMTGRLAPRAGLPSVVFPTGSPTSYVNTVLGNNRRIPAEEITLADVLKASGYATGMIGKWHMGDRAPSLPNDMGFDAYFGALYSNDMKPFALYRDREIEVAAETDQTKLNALYTKEAVNFIEGNSGKESPFFLYFAHNFPHKPLFAGDAQKGQSNAGLYGDVVEGLDWGLEQIVTALKASGQYDNTLIIITSDNGPWYQGDPGNARGRKGKTFEGGMHVPFIAHWPAGIEGGRTVDGMSMGTDLFPTILDWLGLPLPTDRIVDGKSIRPMLESGAETPHDYLYYFEGKQLMSIRDTRYKYHDKRNIVYVPGNLSFGFNSKHGPWLFDTQNDRNESYDVSEKQAGANARLAKAVEAKRTEMKENPRGWVQ